MNIRVHVREEICPIYQVGLMVFSNSDTLYIVISVGAEALASEYEQAKAALEANDTYIQVQIWSGASLGEKKVS